MTATVTMRRYTGADAGTESAPQDTVMLSAADALIGPDVDPGDRSFEAWLRLRVDVAPAVGVANFWLRNVGDLPDGVSILFGIADTPATPVDTVSAVATKTLVSGQKYIFDAGTLADVGDHSRYVVIQSVVDAGAASGAIPEQSFEWGWSER